MIHITPIEIRFADIDAFNHVNNANYLSYIEHARMNFVDDIIGKVDWVKRGFILARAEINFVQPIKLHDQIIVETQCSRIGNKSFDLSYKIFKIDQEEKVEMANAISVQVGYDYKNNLTIPLTEEWRRKLSEPNKK